MRFFLISIYSSILGKPYISGAKISPKLIIVET
jgi:hypothetical protein